MSKVKAKTIQAKRQPTILTAKDIFEWYNDTVVSTCSICGNVVPRVYEKGLLFLCHPCYNQRLEEDMFPSWLFKLDSPFNVLPIKPNLETGNLFYIVRKSSPWEVIDNALGPALHEKALPEIEYVMNDQM
jgi:hypothetical protein